jgi:hypothetical protein
MENIKKIHVLQRKLVKGLQKSVKKYKEYNEDFKKDVQNLAESINEQLFKLNNRKAKVKILTEEVKDGIPALNVTNPRTTNIYAEIASSEDVSEFVEFYLTRSRRDGIPETKLLGAAKYKDGDDKWKISFYSERFPRNINDPMVIHTEFLDFSGKLIAAGVAIVVP